MVARSPESASGHRRRLLGYLRPCSTPFSRGLDRRDGGAGWTNGRENPLVARAIKNRENGGKRSHQPPATHARWGKRLH
ncbi:hypothetical protein WN55_10531 [Dufourea novaeangliae]|uniref:Uncharacterized protein n=1 Tax=Dufourea novaeangliae TaxID=178035 RepID=A0A154P651_DUFNO|nr:hypothetical protein WN55_10531 [Dufourea novaeangliae]